ncbi:MAG: aminotransferase class I/II-fold pyridoxal phosphate-dependent enzyme [Planctomycetota bacterium]
MREDPATRAAHAGSSREDGSPSAAAIQLASFYLSEGDPSSLAYAYGRGGNPTWEALETALGELEDARATSFASGLAACFASILALAETHPRLVLAHDAYYGLRRQAEMLVARGVELVISDNADFAALERELARGPSILWSESPTNPRLVVHDLRRLAAIAKRHGAVYVVDNTTATAALQRPLDLGANLVVTSLTKASSGHSDVIIGSVTTRDERLHERVRAWRYNAGAIPGPFEAWIALRGLKTLPLRIERQSSNALALAELLARHAKVSAVHYPALTARALAETQMSGGFGPLLSFEVHGGAEVADRVVSAARLIRPGTSFGGVESSWERRARWNGETAPPGLIRLSAGIESIRDLEADVLQALS